MKQKDCGCSDDVGEVARENHEGWEYMVQQYFPNLLNVLVENDGCTSKELPSGIQQDGKRKTGAVLQKIRCQRCLRSHFV